MHFVPLNRHRNCQTPWEHWETLSVIDASSRRLPGGGAQMDRAWYRGAALHPSDLSNVSCVLIIDWSLRVPDDYGGASSLVQDFYFSLLIFAL